MFSSTIAVTLLLSQAAVEAAPQSTKVAPPEDPQAKVVCRSVAPVGSMIPRRKCRTVREWNALSEATRNEMQNGVNSGGTNTGG